MAVAATTTPRAESAQFAAMIDYENHECGPVRGFYKLTEKEKSSPSNPRLNIPEEAWSSFTALLGLADGTFQELLAALSDEPPAIDPNQLSRRLATRINSLSPSNVRKIVLTVSALYAVLEDVSLAPTEFASVVRRGIERDFAKEQNLSNKDLDRLEARMNALLNLKSLEATAKAADILTEHQQYMANARILTDIRPVFGRDVEEDPAGAVLIHMLKLGYYRGQKTDEPEEFYLALDTADLDRLIDLLEHAKKKARSLQRTLKAAGVPYIDVAEDGNR